MAQRKLQEEHDMMVRKVAEILTGKKYKKVFADLPDYTKPKRIVWESSGQGYTPDVIACRDEVRIFAVETGDSINDDHTADRWRLFASFAEDNDAMFYIVFPHGARDMVVKRRDELKIQAFLWEL